MSMDDKLPAAFLQAPSPFLPDTHVQFAWDSVSLTSFLSCPRQYQYRIIQGWQPSNAKYAIALIFGIQFHTGLELYHKLRAAGHDHDAAVRGMVHELLLEPATQSLPRDTDVEDMENEQDDDDDGITYRNTKIRTVYHLMRSLVWYLDNYEHDQCRTHILANGKPAVELSFRLPIPAISIAGTPLTLCGHIDRVVDFNGFLHPADYKTTKSLTRQFFDAFQLSHQITGYITAGQAILHKPMKSAMIDGVALQVGGVKFARQFSQRFAGHMQEYMMTLSYVAQQAQRFAEADFYPQNTAACYFCEFKDICSQSSRTRLSYLTQRWQQKPGWNPLENRG